MRSCLRSTLVAGALGLSACFVDGGSSTEVATTTTTTGADSTGSVADPSTSSTATATTDATTAATTGATTDATTGATTEATTTTGGTTVSTGGDEPIADACAGWCAAIAACGLEPAPTCADDCVASTTNHPRPSAACEDAATVLYACAAGLPCNGILEPAIGCPDEKYAAFLACPVCAPTKDGDAMACAIELTCEDSLFTATCAGTQCECAVDGEASGSCVLGMSACALGAQALATAIAGCCGWAG